MGIGVLLPTPTPSSGSWPLSCFPRSCGKPQSPLRGRTISDLHQSVSWPQALVQGYTHDSGLFSEFPGKKSVGQKSVPCDFLHKGHCLSEASSHCHPWWCTCGVQGGENRMLALDSSDAHVRKTGKGQLSFQSQRKAMPKNVQITTQLHSSHMLAK